MATKARGGPCERPLVHTALNTKTSQRPYRQMQKFSLNFVFTVFLMCCWVEYKRARERALINENFLLCLNSIALFLCIMHFLLVYHSSVEVNHSVLKLTDIKKSLSFHQSCFG